MVESQKLPEYNMDTMPLRRGHILILMIASAGQFFGGALAILVGVIAPLIAMTHHPGLSPWLQGFIFACGLIGIMLGSLFFGRFSDKYGYLFFFRLCIFSLCFFTIHKPYPLFQNFTAKVYAPSAPNILINSNRMGLFVHIAEANAEFSI